MISSGRAERKHMIGGAPANVRSRAAYYKKACFAASEKNKKERGKERRAPERESGLKKGLCVQIYPKLDLTLSQGFGIVERDQKKDSKHTEQN